MVYVVAFRNLSVMEFPHVPMEKAGIFLSFRAFDIIASLLAWAEVFESVERNNHRFFHTWFLNDKPLTILSEYLKESIGLHSLLKNTGWFHVPIIGQKSVTSLIPVNPDAVTFENQKGVVT